MAWSRIGLALFVICTAFSASAETDDLVSYSKSAVAKIACSAYAEQSGEDAHYEIWRDLYFSGLTDLRVFLTAVEEGKLTSRELREPVPAQISNHVYTVRISTDFAAGVIAREVTRFAMDQYSIYWDSSLNSDEEYGSYRPTELWADEASKLFTQQDCLLLNRSHDIHLKPMRLKQE